MEYFNTSFKEIEQNSTFVLFVGAFYLWDTSTIAIRINMAGFGQQMNEGGKYYHITPF